MEDDDEHGATDDNAVWGAVRGELAMALETLPRECGIIMEFLICFGDNPSLPLPTNRWVA
jgi:hypothetical protein